MSGLTPVQLSDLLGSAGYYALPARLAAWSRKGVLPALERLKPGAGAGRGAVYGWRDPTVGQQATTLCAGWEYGGQLDTIKLCAWFAGYEYPVAENARDLGSLRNPPLEAATARRLRRR